MEFMGSNKTNETPDQVVLENGEVLILNKSTIESEFMDLEEARRLLKENVKKIYEMNHDL